MKNLFGFEVDDDRYFEEVKSLKSKATIKSEFRRIHGIRKGRFCKDCKYFLEGSYHNRKYFKCQKMGVSHSGATDIRKSDIACSLYDESEENE